MKLFRKNAFAKVILVGCLLAPWGVSAHEPVDHTHATPIEVAGTRLAYPTKVHVQETDAGLEVKGKLKRKGHNNKALRGHVDVELIGSEGQVLESRKISISARTGSSKHDHDRDFSVVLSLPETQEYSVRVTHSMGGRHEHK